MKVSAFITAALLGLALTIANSVALAQDGDLDLLQQPVSKDCERNLTQKCTQTCLDIVWQDSEVYAQASKLGSKTWFCVRPDPSVGLQRARGDISDTDAQSLKDQGYTCNQSIPSEQQSFERCYTSCLQNLCKPVN